MGTGLPWERERAPSGVAKNRQRGEKNSNDEHITFLVGGRPSRELLKERREEESELRVESTAVAEYQLGALFWKPGGHKPSY